MVGKCSQPGRHKACRTDGYASSAVDTCSFSICRYLIFRQAQQRGGTLCHRHLHGEQALTHHRTARYGLFRLLFETAGFLHQLLVDRPCADCEVLRICDRIPCHCDDLMHQRPSKDYGFVGSHCCLHIIHHAPCVCGKHTGVGLPSGGGIDQ